MPNPVLTGGSKQLKSSPFPKNGSESLLLEEVIQLLLTLVHTHKSSFCSNLVANKLVYIDASKQGLS